MKKISLVFVLIVSFTTAMFAYSILVYEGEANGNDYSGTFIHETFNELGIESTYSNLIPISLNSFDAVFLSFGSIGYDLQQGTFPTNSNISSIIAYVQAGGKVYVESSSLFYGMQIFEYQNWQLFRQLFGIQSAYFNIQGVSNPINGLSGFEGTATEDMYFSSSTQTNSWFIDIFTPNANGEAVFREPEYGNVAVQSEGNYDQKTFAFSYSLADLVDGTFPSTREELLLNLIEFFEVPVLVPDFYAEPTTGQAPLLVEFYDNSLIDPDITTWSWDFDNDGLSDSNEQNPTWIYNEPGTYSVSLMLDNGYESQTKTIENYINVTGTGINVEIIPLKANLGVNYPNPFNPTTNIAYSLVVANNVSLQIYNSKGQLVKTLVNCEKNAGSYSVIWNGTDDIDRQVSSGIYFYKLKAGKYTNTKKMILMK